MSAGRVRASSALSSSEEEAGRARQQLEALEAELGAERRAAEELRAARDQLQVGAGLRPFLDLVLWCLLAR